ncbi:MAG: DUF2934 domain-containing protein [Candidatus Omnitrophica bacterium]|nr:DUF2934 domain-containing protein [Candidatus Omnitrophota bacterium]
MARTSTVTRTSSSKGQDLTDAIRKKAYELYEKRGKKPGHALDDWLEAERIIKQRTF